MAADFVSCPDCGHGVIEGEAFCQNCRVPLEWTDSDDESWTNVDRRGTWNAVDEKPEPKKEWGWGTYVVFALIIMAGVRGVPMLFDNDDGAASPAPFKQQPAAVEDRYYAYVDDVPNYLTSDQAKVAMDSVTAAIQAWSQSGVQIQRVASERDANMHIQFIKEWGGDTLGQQYGITGGLLQIGLGNSECQNEWIPFAGSSVYWITAHELGHAFGLDHANDPDDLMYPNFNPRYGDWCKMWDDATSWSAGDSKGLRFNIANDASIKYDVADRDNGALDVCIMTQSDWDNLNSNGMRGYACHDDVNYAIDSANIPAGHYVLAMRCENYFDNCVVDYSLWRYP